MLLQQRRWRSRGTGFTSKRYRPIRLRALSERRRQRQSRAWRWPTLRQVSRQTEIRKRPLCFHLNFCMMENDHLFTKTGSGHIPKGKAPPKVCFVLHTRTGREVVITGDFNDFSAIDLDVQGNVPTSHALAILQVRTKRSFATPTFRC